MTPPVSESLGLTHFASINGRRHFPLELVIRGDMQFGTLSDAALNGRTPYNFVLEESESSPDIARCSHLVLPYFVVLDYNGMKWTPVFGPVVSNF